MEEKLLQNAENPNGYPETWIPTSPTNPSNLQKYLFVNGEWKPTVFCKFVPWPEKYNSIKAA